MTKSKYMEKWGITVSPATRLDKQQALFKTGKEYAYIICMAGFRFFSEKGTMKDIRKVKETVMYRCSQSLCEW